MANESGKMYHFNTVWEKAMKDLDPSIGPKLWTISEKLVGFSKEDADTDTPHHSEMMPRP